MAPMIMALEFIPTEMVYVPLQEAIHTLNHRSVEYIVAVVVGNVQ